MEIGEYFMVRLPVWSTNFFQKKSNLIFSVDMGRGGVGVRVWVIGLELLIVSKAVLRAFFEVSLLVTLEPHVPWPINAYTRPIVGIVRVMWVNRVVKPT